MIPSIESCYQLMDTYGMLPNIREHSIMVARVAEVIAHGVLAAQIPISLELTIAGSLLHDIAKTGCLTTGEDHSEKGMEIFLRHGFPEGAAIVAQHVVLKNGLPARGVTEKEIVYYADKRVKHDQIVTLDERQVYILERYGQNNEERYQAILMNFGICRKLEERLFQWLRFSPSHLTAAIDAFRPSSLIGAHIRDAEITNLPGSRPDLGQI